MNKNTKIDLKKAIWEKTLVKLNLRNALASATNI